MLKAMLSGKKEIQPYLLKDLITIQMKRILLINVLLVSITVFAQTQDAK
jgi:hypothetical protein